MIFKPISSSLFVSGQISPEDVAHAADSGVRLIICNRPDGEDAGQPSAAAIAAEAQQRGIQFAHIPILKEPSDDDVARMEAALDGAGGPTLAYCRSGTRSTKVGVLALAARVRPEQLLSDAAGAGFEIGSLRTRLGLRYAARQAGGDQHFDVLVAGGGAAGIATAASLLRRDRALRIAIVEPADHHFYQPGWTMVGAGIFSQMSTRRPIADVVPKGATLIKESVVRFAPSDSKVHLKSGREVSYDVLVVAMGLTLDWHAIEGLEDALGRNGVTSNYRFDLAPYTARLVSEWRGGRALFTQAPMPIKCAGAPQKALYLSCDAWRRNGVLAATDVAFHTAAPALFGVAEYIPSLMEYIQRYGVDLRLGSRLVAVDADASTATFERTAQDGTIERKVQPFDMLHVCPPQVAPRVVAQSELAGAGGYVEVDPTTLRHPRFANIFALGDVAATTNAKTAAAVRKQAPVVARNIVSVLNGTKADAVYDGYGSCPLTVERGRIVLAEFGYGGKLLPTFPKWLLDGTRPSRGAWWLKEHLLPPLYWQGMLKGREWLAAPKSDD